MLGFFLPLHGEVVWFVSMKSVLLVLFAATSVALTGCTRSDADWISSVLNRCAEVSRRAAAYNANPGVQADFIATEFQKIDVSSCPADFRMAYQAHVFAWQQAGPALANNSFGTNVLEGVVAGLTENPGFIGGASGQASMATEQINGTYYQLTQIAARYGARIPTSVTGR
jgi:hypothetical protein